MCIHIHGDITVNAVSCASIQLLIVTTFDEYPKYDNKIKCTQHMIEFKEYKFVMFEGNG